MIAYFDCFSGASGDMILAALLDAGLTLETLQAELARLGLEEEYRLEVEEVQRGSLGATRLRVVVARSFDRQCPEVVEGLRTPHPHPPARHLGHITHLIEESSLAPGIKEKSISIFQRLAAAEAYVHRTSVEEVHFHEVGAVDAIVDVVGAAIGLEALGVSEVYASPLPVGGGAVQSRHGTLPLPAPATLELIAAAKAPTRPWGEGVELVTPTGAAILTTLAQFRQPEMVIHRVGYGAGEVDLPWPNVLRLWLGEPHGQGEEDMVLLETNIDDMNPEVYGYVMERLFGTGALDVYFTPIYMKKNRPGTMLSVIARQREEAALAEVILRETTTLGLRVVPIRRYEALREMRTVPTAYGEIPVKLKLLGGRVLSASPEHDVCRRIASEREVPLIEVYRAALQASAMLTGGKDGDAP